MAIFERELELIVNPSTALHQQKTLAARMRGHEKTFPDVTARRDLRPSSASTSSSVATTVRVETPSLDDVF